MSHLRLKWAHPAAMALCCIYSGCTAAVPETWSPSGKSPVEAPTISEDSEDAYTRRTTILGTVGYSEGVNGTFAASGYVGFVFTGVAGSSVAIDVASLGDRDPVAFLYGPKRGATWNQRRPIASNDDAIAGDLAGTLNSHIEHAITADGTYLIVVAEYNEQAGGNFGVRLTCADGVCQKFCGGIVGLPCPDGLTCVDDPSDDCDPRAGSADCGGICIDREGEGCRIGGCSGQLCVAAELPPIASTCEWREEYGCYRTATCEKQSNGKCGWTETPELLECIDNARGPITDCRTTGCATGKYCSYCWGNWACIPEGAIC